MSAGFAPDPRLAQDSHLLAQGPLSQLRLMDDLRFPWLVLVPRLDGASEWLELEAREQGLLLEELNAAEKQRRAAAVATKTEQAPPAPSPAPPVAVRAGDFRCDGRQYCSQMTSCAEAKYFLLNCPGVKMDGDHNGVPCEKQWCAR